MVTLEIIWVFWKMPLQNFPVHLEYTIDQIIETVHLRGVFEQKFNHPKITALDRNFNIEK